MVLATGSTPPRLLGIELELEVFSGPFDLLLALVVREEVDLREVDLAAIVLAYIDQVERQGDLDLGVATEFILLIAALLELKSKLLLPQREVEELLELGPAEAAEELLARMVESNRYHQLAGELRERLAQERGVRYRRVPLPPHLRATVPAPLQPLDPDLLPRALGGLLRRPPPLDLRHILRRSVSLQECLGRLRRLLRRGSFAFEEAVAGADRLTVAVTLLALLELHRQGEASWEQKEPFGEIKVVARTAPTGPLREAHNGKRSA